MNDGDSYGGSPLVLRESLRRVPPTAPLLQARTTKRLNLTSLHFEREVRLTFGLPAHRSFRREEIMSETKSKPYIPGLNAGALRPRWVNSGVQPVSEDSHL